MKQLTILLLIALFFVSCGEDKNKQTIDEYEVDTELSQAVLDSIAESTIDKPKEKTIAEQKAQLESKGFKTFNYIDQKTQDTILMQQYFMAFLKAGPIRGQNEEESAELQKQHLAHLAKMYELGYADISGPFGDDGKIRGITIYNVPTLKMADSLANSDPMVKAGRLEIEIHPWWAAKGFQLR